VKKLFARRRVGASLAGSLLLHASLFAAGTRGATPQAPAREPPVEISVRVASVPAPVRNLVAATAGERPSGRGHALAGSNPVLAGAPRHAVRPRTATGHAAGAGSTAAEPAVPVPAPVDSIGVPLLPAATTAPEPSSRASPTVDADATFDRLARELTMRLSRGNGGGLAGFGDRKGGTGMGLTTELSGRHVVTSRVLFPPVVVRARPVECVLAVHLNTLVRVLITRTGEPAAPRVAVSSGDSRFDACALAYVSSMTFSAGQDALGHPLDVWMNVRVSPLADGRLGAMP